MAKTLKEKIVEILKPQPPPWYLSLVRDVVDRDLPCGALKISRCCVANPLLVGLHHAGRAQHPDHPQRAPNNPSVSAHDPA